MFLFTLFLVTQVVTTFGQVDTSSGSYLPSETDGSCGVATDVGQEDFGDYPFLAAVGYNVGGKILYESDAILINRRYVLSHAAFNNAEHPVAEIILGQNTFDAEGASCPSCKPTQKFAISPADVIVHPDFKIEEMLKSGNEILLIRLPEAATTYLEDKKAAVLPICVPWNVTGSQGEPSAKGELFVAAWERRTKDTGFFHGVNSGQVNYMAGETCKKIPAFSLISTDRHVCAGEPDGSDACVGRNGAPLFERTGDVMYLRGMASFGPLPCHDVSTKGIPGVYASIDFYVPWIKSQLKP